jgi:hypothetical protein
MLCIGAAAFASTITPSYLSASVAPRHRSRAPYTYTTRGAIHYRRCPHGTTNHNYCTDLPPGQVCKGSVALNVKLGVDRLLADSRKKVLTTSGALKGNCTYSITTTLPTSVLTARSRYRRGQHGVWAYVSFSAKFAGNSVLAAKAARQQNVRAKLTQP